MRPTCRLGLTVICILVLLAAMSATAQMFPTSGASESAFLGYFVASGDAGYMIMPPVLLCGPVVGDAKWSWDGKYIGVKRTTHRFTPAQITMLMKPPTDQELAQLLQADLGD